MANYAELSLSTSRPARTVALAPAVASPPSPLFAPSRFGAGCELSAFGAADRSLLWRCSDAAGCVLELQELSLTSDLRGAALSLVFPAALLGSVSLCLDPEPGARRPLLLFCLTADGAAHVVALPSPASLQQGGRAADESILADGLPAFRSVDVNEVLARLVR